MGSDGDGDGYGVTTKALVSAGDSFVEAGDEATEGASKFVGELEGHGGDNKGFVTTKTADTLASQWQEQAEDLATRTSVTGDLLQEGSDGYRSVERSVAETLPSLGAED